MAGFDFKVNMPRSRKNITGGGSNALQNMILRELMYRERGGDIGESMGSIEDQLGKVPVGTSISLGGLTVPVNRALTNDELSAVTAERAFVPIGEDIKSLTGSGTFEPQATSGIPILENFERTFRQWAAGQPNALFTSFDPRLQEVQGKINSIRRYVFGEGGKQLTPYEGKVVNALLTPFGKSDEQYMTDIDEALRLIREKANLVRGGSLEAQNNPIPGLSQNYGSRSNKRSQYNLMRSRGLSAQEVKRRLGF